MMMSRRARLGLMCLLSMAAACASTDRATADPEARRLSPPGIIEEPEPEPEVEAARAETEVQAVTAAAKDPNTEVITFTGPDASPGMADEVTAAPKRDPLPSMMSDILNGPQ